MNWKNLFCCDTVRSDRKDLAKRTISDKILKGLMKLPEIMDMMDIKEHEKVWFISFLIGKQGQE